MKLDAFIFIDINNHFWGFCGYGLLEAYGYVLGNKEYGAPVAGAYTLPETF